MALALNPQQERAVRAEGHCVVLACPGSGKTRVLSTRATRLLAENETGRLVAVTFTRDAAGELKERIIESCAEIGLDVSKRVEASTFHSLALAQLKRLWGRRIPKVIADGHRFTLVRRVWEHYGEGSDVTLDDALALIDSSKSMMDPPPMNDVQSRIYRGYEELLQAEGVMDFSDLVLRATREMREGNLTPFNAKWLLVDESQDMDDVQREWVKCHGESGIHVTLVGDDDQSLYGFRMALGYDGMLSLGKHLNAQFLTLPINYRCAPNILGPAAQLIARNKDRAEKQIEAFQTDLGEIEVVRYNTRADEVRAIVVTLKEQLATGQEPQDWAVLARTNSILDLVDAECSGAGIPYYRVGQKSIWEKPAPAAMLGLLQALAGGPWVGVSNALFLAGVPAHVVSSMNSLPARRPIERLYAAAKHQQDTKEYGESGQQIIALSLKAQEWQSQLAQGNRENLVIKGVAAWIAEFAKGELKKIILETLRPILCRVKGTIPVRINFVLSRNTDPDHGVALLSHHASKGLEFKSVWMMAMEDGIVPHVDGTTEEERRLAYVGMTRAKKRLFLSSAMEEGPESRFIEESGIRVVQSKPLGPPIYKGEKTEAAVL